MLNVPSGIVPIAPQAGQGPDLELAIVSLIDPDRLIPELNAVPQLSQKAGKFAIGCPYL